MMIFMDDWRETSSGDSPGGFADPPTQLNLWMRCTVKPPIHSDNHAAVVQNAETARTRLTRATIAGARTVEGEMRQGVCPLSLRAVEVTSDCHSLWTASTSDCCQAENFSSSPASPGLPVSC
jgi:large subunit ribosomal protein L31